MIIIKHRINKINEINETPFKYGVEIDLRSNLNSIYLHHDPLKIGVKFNEWIKYFKHKLLVLNVKEEGLEKKIITILKKNKISNFFFMTKHFPVYLKVKKLPKYQLDIQNLKN